MVQLKAEKITNKLQIILISIPYGSIKSISPLAPKYVLFVFQFLMVQLKVRFEQENENVTLISIPYGSIKSQSNYLYVDARKPYFNSLWFN